MSEPNPVTDPAATPNASETAPQQTSTTPATAAVDGGQTPAAAPAATTPPAAPAGAPESYDFSVPEGRQFGDDVISEFSAASKELNLTQEAAQKMLDRMAPAIEKQQTAAIEGMKSLWAEQVQADPEIGGEKMKENIAVSERALEQFGSPELTNLLKQTGLSQHPEVIRLLYKVGTAISEDGFVSGRGGDGKPADARRLYAASNMNP